MNISKMEWIVGKLGIKMTPNIIEIINSTQKDKTKQWVNNYYLKN